MLSAACSGAARAPAPAVEPGPPAIPLDSLDVPPIELLSLSPDEIAAPTTLAGFPVSVVASDFDLPIHHNPRVQHYLDLMTVRHRRSAEAWLTRQGRFDAMIEARLRAAGLPTTLKYLPLVESGYLTDVTSRASARGLWQFVAGTARIEGLEVSDQIDDRVDPFLSTDAAIRHLARLHGRYGNWFLALAAYNSGAGRVDRALAATGVSPATDSAFWHIYDQLPRETRDYVPFFMAASVVSRYPAAFGFGDLVRDQPLRFDEVTVPDETDLAVVARVLDVHPDSIVALNPRYRTRVTPRGRAAPLRVPEGMAGRFNTAYAALPVDKRVAVRWHVVKRGETLSGIAARYGSSVAVLQRENGVRRPSQLQIGARLRIPGSGSSGPAVVARTEVVTHRVRPGESLWSIAQRYGVRTEDLRAWNDLDDRTVIHPGDRLEIRR